MTAPIRLAAAGNSAVFAWMGGVGSLPVIGWSTQLGIPEEGHGSDPSATNGAKAIARGLQHGVQPARPASGNRVLR
jgi:hypothetical protein